MDFLYQPWRRLFLWFECEWHLTYILLWCCADSMDFPDSLSLHLSLSSIAPSRSSHYILCLLWVDVNKFLLLSLIGIILRWGFLIYELIFIYCGLFVLILVVFFVFFCVVSSFTTFWPNFTSGLLQVILPRPRIGMQSLVTVSLIITAFHSCCLSHHVFDQVNLWPAWVGFETAIFWQCSPGIVETQRLYPLRSRMDFLVL